MRRAARRLDETPGLAGGLGGALREPADFVGDDSESRVGRRVGDIFERHPLAADLGRLDVFPLALAQTNRRELQELADPDLRGIELGEPVVRTSRHLAVGPRARVRLWLVDRRGGRLEGGQFIFIFRELELVVVTTSSTDVSDERWDYRERLLALVARDIVAPLASRVAPRTRQPVDNKAPA